MKAEGEHLVLNSPSSLVVLMAPGLSQWFSQPGRARFSTQKAPVAIDNISIHLNG